MRSKGQLVAPQGAVLTGRICRLAKYASPYPCFAVGLEFFGLAFDGKRARLSAQLEEVGPSAGISRASGRGRIAGPLPPASARRG